MLGDNSRLGTDLCLSVLLFQFYRADFSLALPQFEFRFESGVLRASEFRPSGWGMRTWRSLCSPLS